MKLDFGYIGVSVEDYTKESLYALLIEHTLDNLVDKQSLIDYKPSTKNTFLQSVCPGPFRKGTTIDVHEGFIQFVTDIDNFLLILSIGILDPDAANSLIEELYLQGLIKPRWES